jgi:alkylation response protein AidB-like acyl-CoA dehydrogenase
MSDYQAPVKDMLFVIRDLAGLNKINELPGYTDATVDLAEAVLDEAAQLAAEVIAPTNALGDSQGTRVNGDQVAVPEAFKAAYQQFIEGGWGGIAQSVDIGGQGLPYLIGLSVEEMWQSANLAWSLCPLLSQGAARAIETHGDAALKKRVLEQIVSGAWTGTMNLSEPQAGSDLAAVRSQAVPDGEGYRISGQKIFITWGDHDMTENVIHLVLARLPDVPEGVKGLSLFAVPRNLILADGGVGERNGVKPVSVEHKLGIHGSPTCVMAFENAYGYIIGEPNRGLACMFTMMNHARLGVGLEGVAIAERAYQQALAYAKDRVQGQAPGTNGRVTIIHHPDVRRMLLFMKSQIEAMRSVAYVAGAYLDHAHRDPDADRRACYQARLDLMTPVVKGWCTETAQLLTSVGLQIHGGMGYVEETGAAQHFRDARITTIYEGTTGIQANDLVGRKILRDGGVALQALIEEIGRADQLLERCGENLATIRVALAEGCSALAGAGQWLLASHKTDAHGPGAAAFSMLMLMGTVTGGWQMALAAVKASDYLTAGADDRAFYEAKIISARFYAEQIMPVAAAYRRAIESGSETVMALSEDQF